ncbi:MAG: DUF6519 domain-containing protein, partial [bacterium]
ENGWLKLEDGIEIQFQPGDNTDVTYRTGDYWLIPARTETGDVEWPRTNGNPDAKGPHGIFYHYAPLAIVRVGANGSVSVKDDCRCEITPLAQ